MKRIRVSAIDGVAKKAALGAMLFSSVVMFATTPNRNTRTENPPQAEVVSREGADALKAITFPGQQQNTAVPTVHNQKLDENLLKCYDTEQEKQEVMKFLSNNYNKYGSYLGSAIVQQYIDLNMFLAFLDGNNEILKRFDEDAYNKIDKEAMKKVTEKSGPIKEWLNAYYFSVYKQPFGQFDHMPNYEEIDNALTDYMMSNPNKLFSDEIEGVLIGSMVEYEKKLKSSDMDELQKKSNLIAFKTSIADYMLFYNLIKQAGIYINYKDAAAKKNFKIFMETIEPQASL